MHIKVRNLTNSTSDIHMHKVTIFFGSIITILFLTLAQKGHTSFFTVSQLIKEPSIGKLKVSNGIEEWNISEK
ncbi:MAG: hypothetical protein ACKVLF_06455, partial [Nitrospinaceae bacterium]